jgi:hypothetical protein
MTRATTLSGSLHGNHRLSVLIRKARLPANLRPREEERLLT